MQIITSKMTSINSKCLPAIYKKINWEKIKKEWFGGYSPTVLDYGCGKYTEHIVDFLYMHGIHIPPIFYDPYWFPLIDVSWRYPDIVICSNVLNVIDDNEEVKRIHQWIRDHSQLYFIMVYEGNKSFISRETKKDCFQRNLPTKEYIMYSDENVKHKVLTAEPFMKFIN